MKNGIVLLLLALFLSLLGTGCTAGEKREGDLEMSQDGERSLTAGGYQLDFREGEMGWELEVAEGEQVLFRNPAPAIIVTMSGSKTEDLCTTKAAYDSVTLTEGKICCQAQVVTEKGASFLVEDLYYTEKEMFLVDRTVTVTGNTGEERGFASMYQMIDPDGGTKEDYEYFIPSILYKDSDTLKSSAIMANLTSVNYVKETRCGTPLAMIRGKADGYSMGIVHVNPQISCSKNTFKQTPLVSNTQNYGSLGFTLDAEQEYPVSVDFVYPSTETPVSYETGGAVRRYYEITEGNAHSYTLGLISGKSDLYNQAMVDTYLAAISLESMEIAEVDLTQVYDLNIELYEKLYLRYEGADGKYSSGFPFAVNVKDFDDFYAVSFQMGFIGAQTAIAAELIRDGVRNDNEDALQMGQEILDFWTADYVYDNVLPPSWWQPANDNNAGASTGYPSFLRCFVDGAEGMLNACLYAKEAGLDHSRWEGAVLKMADFLVENQNEDGSYYRAYNVDGTVCTDTSSAAYQGTSKLNTPVAVRFLCSMYDYTGDSKYRDAAVKAADYCYEELYLKLGKYVGGTPDNPNVPDKEAAIYALYAFSAVYDMTGDEKYYPALEHAAVSAMSWVYTYDFAVEYSSTMLYDSLNIFKEGNTAGWSMIATGHSAMDVFGATAYYELFRQYLRSGDEAYEKLAGLLMNNTKKAMDLNSEWGYLYQGFALEACNVADQIFYTAENGVWLPWISAAYMEPMIQMENTFGNYDFYELLEEHTREELLEQMK